MCIINDDDLIDRFNAQKLTVFDMGLTPTDLAWGKMPENALNLKVGGKTISG